MNTGILPDELVKEILSPLILVPDSKFFDVEEISPFSTPSPSCSAYLVVCKQWMRVATPLLYDCIVVRSKAQAQAMEKVLKENPTFGLLVQKLRVEGGFSMHMHQIIASCPNIHDLALSLKIWSSDNVSGLTKGLYTMTNIRRLVLLAGRMYTPPGNKVAQSFNDALVACIQDNWKLMHTCHCSWNWDGRQFGPGQLKNAICAAPALRTLYLRVGYASNATHFQSLAGAKNLRKIYLWTPTSFGGFLPHLDRDVLTAIKTALGEGVDLEVQGPVGMSKAPPKAITISPTSASFIPLQGVPEALQDVIWGRIIRIACEGDHVYSSEDLSPTAQSPRRCQVINGLGLMSINIGSVRFHIARVSRQFHRLALLYLHHDVHLRSFRHVYGLARLLLEKPEIGPTIRTLNLNFSTSSFGRIRECYRPEFSPLSARLQEALSQQPENDIAARDLEAQVTIRSIQDALSRKNRAAWGDSSDDDDEYEPPELDIAPHLKTLHLSLEFIFSQCTELIKLCSDGQFDMFLYLGTLHSGLDSTAGRDLDNAMEEACAPFWRAVQRLKGEKLLSLALFYRTFAGRKMDLSRFPRLKYLGLRPPGVVKHNGEHRSEPHAVSKLPDTGPPTVPVEQLSYFNEAVSQPLSDSRTLKSLVAHRFPSLTALNISLSDDYRTSITWDPECTSLWKQFLEQNGRNLRTLEMSKPCGLDIFAHCPSLETLNIEYIAFPLHFTRGPVELSCPTPHTSLRKIILGYVGVTATKKEHDARVLQAFETFDLGAFPALKEIQVNACKWPTSEREIKKGKNLWVPISEMLEEKFGVHLTNKEGVHWRPRLQVAGPKKRASKKRSS